MITRNLSVEDAKRVHEAFRSVSISHTAEHPPDYGFCDYPLTLGDFKARLYDSRLSIALEDRQAGKRQLLAYLLAYPFHQVADLDTSHDAVLEDIHAHPEVIYFDQLYMKPGLPLHIAGRLLDTWTNLAWGSTRQGVVAAVPQKPWKNVPSTRFIISRGFKREGVVKQGDLELGVFTKPFWELGDRCPVLKLG